jgi:HSP20 family molecular chaperone IbpA
MNLQEFVQRDDRFVRTYAYDDETVVVADLAGADAGEADFSGAALAEDAHVDVLDDTVIVVTPGDDQFELSVPATPTTAFIRNGVLTIEMEADQ